PAARAAAEPAMSLAGSARQLTATLLDAGRQRLELAALDVEEEVLRAGGAIAAMLAAAVLSAVALIAACAAVVIALWDYAPVATPALLAVLFAAGAALVVRRLAHVLRSKPI